MRRTALFLTVISLAAGACTTPAPPVAPPSDQQPITASPSTPVEREPVPGVEAPKDDKNGKNN